MSVKVSGTMSAPIDCTSSWEASALLERSFSPRGVGRCQQRGAGVERRPAHLRPAQQDQPLFGKQAVEGLQQVAVHGEVDLGEAVEQVGAHQYAQLGNHRGCALQGETAELDTPPAQLDRADSSLPSWPPR